ncbi:CBS domain-containing protein [Nitrospira sp. Kam-Ns4a]
MAKQKAAMSDRQLADFTRLTVERFMERDVQVGHRRTKADVLASQMIEGFGAVPIVDEQQRLVGIVSEFDLLGALEQGRRWSEITAEEIMSVNPYSIWPETDLSTLVHVLRASKLIRVPVVDVTGTLVGIVARRDILRGYLNYGLSPSL